MCSNLIGILFSICIQLTMYGGPVVDPFENNVPHRGINLFLSQNDVELSTNFEWNVQLFLDRAAAAGLNSISLTWPIYVDGPEGNRVYMRDKESLTSESIEEFTRIARARGFGVWLNPLVDEKNLMTVSKGSWRGNLSPMSSGQWLMNYMNIMNYYAQAAEKAGASGIVIGTELWSIEQYQDEWEIIVTEVRRQFGGKITYSSNRSIELSKFPWEIVDYVSINYFPNLDLPNSATVKEIQTLIERDVREFTRSAAELNMPLMIKETGVTSQKNSLRVTGKWNHGTAPDHETQRRFYEAICRVWSDHTVGIYWWNTVLHPIPEDQIENDKYFNPFGKPAEQHLGC